MKYLDPMPTDAQTEIRHSIHEHTEVLRELLTDSAGHGRQYLTLANGGAAVALMAFMGANERIRTSPSAWASLGLFTAGVIMVGLLSILDYFARQKDLELWVNDSGKFFANEIEIEDLYGRLNSRNKTLVRRPVVAGCLAFGFFVTGAGLSVGHFLLSSIHPPHCSQAISKPKRSRDHGNIPPRS